MNTRLLRAWIAGMVCLGLWAAPGFAQGQGQGKGQGKGKAEARDRDDDRDEERDQDREHGRIGTPPIFGSRDRGIIVRYYRNRYSNLPPGLAKRHGNLPPGLQKHLERDGTLPPGLQKRVESFPPDLERQLPRLPSIYRRGRIGPDVVILDRRTSKIVDVIHDVIELARD